MTTIIVTGKANTLSRQLAEIQRLGLVSSGPRIVADDHGPISPYGAWDGLQDIDADAPGYTPGLSEAVV